MQHEGSVRFSKASILGSCKYVLFRLHKTCTNYIWLRSYSRTNALSLLCAPTGTRILASRLSPRKSRLRKPIQSRKHGYPRCTRTFLKKEEESLRLLLRINKPGPSKAPLSPPGESLLSAWFPPAPGSKDTDGKGRSLYIHKSLPRQLAVPFPTPSSPSPRFPFAEEPPRSIFSNMIPHDRIAFHEQQATPSSSSSSSSRVPSPNHPKGKRKKNVGEGGSISVVRL